MGYGFPNYLEASFPGDQHALTQFTLCEHARDIKFTVVANPFSRKHLLTIHDGSTFEGEILAAVGRPMLALQATICIHTIQVGDTTIKMTVGTNDVHRRYRFSLDLGESYQEKFEWRATKGNEVTNMFLNATGYKLVRLGSVGPGNGKGGARRNRHVDETSDGKEVVAVWATEKDPLWMKFAKMIRPFKFELRASGRSRKLGDLFNYVALATALKIWSWEAQRYSSAPNGIPQLHC
ncbi:hypothetical protein F5Y11DRAFT_330019 [Daldinia sp. FL1419]|nr:hypothetical protein F5Y11DRAFT_330019 [Daldinia sp. FL1419]